MRAFPPLVLLVLVVHGLPFLGIEPPPLLGVGIALTINTSTYYGEILRAHRSIEPTQWEAARSTGLGPRRRSATSCFPRGSGTCFPTWRETPWSREADLAGERGGVPGSPADGAGGAGRSTSTRRR